MRRKNDITGRGGHKITGLPKELKTTLGAWLVENPCLPTEMDILHSVLDVKSRRMTQQRQKILHALNLTSNLEAIIVAADPHHGVRTHGTTCKPVHQFANPCSDSFAGLAPSLCLDWTLLCLSAHLLHLCNCECLVHFMGKQICLC